MRCWPVLYLRSLSSGDRQDALAALLGPDAPNLSPSAIGRLKGSWQAEYDRWQRRDLSARRHVYIWADGVHLQVRRQDAAAYMLGARERERSWRKLLLDLKARGLAAAPEIAVGDGAMGFWKAVEEVRCTKHQRRWQHVLDNVPKPVQPTMKADLRKVRDAPDGASAETAIAVFAEKYGAKYPKAMYPEAVTCLAKDRDTLPAFFAFPAKHRDHLRTANPIESVFAAVRRGTVRAKDALSQTAARLMVLLVMAAAESRRELPRLGDA